MFIILSLVSSALLSSARGCDSFPGERNLGKLKIQIVGNPQFFVPLSIYTGKILLCFQCYI